MRPQHFSLRAARRALAALALPVAFAASACRAPEPAGPVLIFAASDLRDALGDIAAAYRRTGGDSVALVFGSTGDLGTQIANGAPADLFFAANAEAIDALAAKGLIVDSTRRVYAIGRLALIGRCVSAPCTPLALSDLARPATRTVAIANPAHAPYGKAAKQTLERSGLWMQVAPKLVLGANISQAEQFVATGNADAGLVALSLVLRTPGRVYTPVDSALHDPLRQTAAVTTASAHAAAALAFLRFVEGEAGATLMRRYGFSAPDHNVR